MKLLNEHYDSLMQKFAETVEQMNLQLPTVRQSKEQTKHLTGLILEHLNESDSIMENLVDLAMNVTFMERITQLDRVPWEIWSASACFFTVESIPH